MIFPFIIFFLFHESTVDKADALYPMYFMKKNKNKTKVVIIYNVRINMDSTIQNLFSLTNLVKPVEGFLFFFFFYHKIKWIRGTFLLTWIVEYYRGAKKSFFFLFYLSCSFYRLCCIFPIKTLWIIYLFFVDWVDSFSGLWPGPSCQIFTICEELDPCSITSQDILHAFII